MAKLYDLTGRIILENTFPTTLGENPASSGTGKIEIDVSGVAKGVYVLRVVGENGVARGKVVVD